MDLTVIAAVGSAAAAVCLVPFLANHLVRHLGEPRRFPRPRRHGSGMIPTRDPG